MPVLPEVLCLSTSSALRRFDKPLLAYLSKQRTVGRWEYTLSPDEPSSLETAIVMLHDYLKSGDRPLHLIGHGINGVLGLMYAQRHPERVKSLTLLAVGVNPAIDWKAQYYFYRNFMPCSRETVLTQMAHSMFGYEDRYLLKVLTHLLAKDLDATLSLHSLFRQGKIAPTGSPTPLLVCGSQDDPIVDRHALQQWSEWVKEGDRVWEYERGRHFFHYFHAEPVGRQIVSFWRSLEAATTNQSNKLGAIA